jgi:hypothetical protein
VVAAVAVVSSWGAYDARSQRDWDSSMTVLRDITKARFLHFIDHPDEAEEIVGDYM